MARTIHLGCWVEYMGTACVVLASSGGTGTSNPTSLDLWRLGSGTIVFVGVVPTTRVLLSTPDLSALATSVMESSHAPA